MTMSESRWKQNKKEAAAKAIWPAKKPNLFQRIPLEVIVPVGLFGTIGVMAFVTISNSGERDRAAQAAFHQEVVDATNGQQQAPTVTPDTTAPAPGFDFTLPLIILGALAVIGVASYFLFPRIKSALKKRRERKAFRVNNAATWNELFARRDALTLAWSKYETDVALMIDYPIMTDYTDPVVHKVITAMQKVRKASMNADPDSPADSSPLHDAVDEFEAAFTTAEKYARRYGQSKLDPREQKKLATARQALNIILDGSAPSYEIEAAYKSLRSSLKGIIDVPEQALRELESVARRELVHS